MRTLPRFASLEPEKNRHLTRKTLRFAFWEGTTGITALSIADSFLGPLAIALKGTTFQIGMLSVLPQLGAALAQLLTHRFVGWFHSRKRTMLATVGLSALPWLVIAWLPHLSLADPVAWLIPLALAVQALHNLPVPAWGSWISDLVPLRRRGHYLGLRAAVAGFVASLVVLGFGLLLDLMGSRVYLGFSLVFLVATALRLTSLLLVARMYEPPARKGADGLGLYAFLKTIGQSNLGRLVLYVSLLYAGVYVAGPFFAILMLRDLGFSYTTYMFLQTVNVVATIAGSRLWGLYADKRGTVAVLRITGAGLSLIPFFWLLSQRVPFLVVCNLWGGFMWGGFSLCTLNFVYEAVPSAGRTRAVGYFNAFAGVGVFVGGTVGGFLASRVPVLFPYQIMTLLLISGVVRLLASASLLPFIRETRPRAPLSEPRPAPDHPGGHL